MEDRLNDWNYGLLKQREVYDASTALVKTVDNTYSVVNTQLTTTEYKSMKTSYYREASSNVFTQNANPTSCNQVFTYHDFRYRTYYPYTGRSQLSQTIEKAYFKNGSTSETITQYEYDNTLFYPTKVSTYNSGNDKTENFLFYPHNYSTSSSSYKLFQKGIKANPVSSLTLLSKPNGSKFITALRKSEFQEFPGFIIKPLKLSSMKSSTPISTTLTSFTPEQYYGQATDKSTVDINYDSYNTQGSNIQATAKSSVLSAIWDKDYRVITAKANAAVNDIACTSFETSEKGNWDYDLFDCVFDFTSPAGKKSYFLHGQAISKSGLNASSVYIVTYWSKNGSCSVNGSSPFASGKSSNGWVFYKHKITGSTTVSITGNVMLDELKLFPENARLTSVTYEPLLGLTSESGLEGEIKKYQYDSYGRLLAQRDEYGKLLKLYCYGIGGSSTECSGAQLYANDAYTTTVYKNCPSGVPPYSAGGMQYTVPAGRYVSFLSKADADAQALDDARTFGQGLAQINGTCNQGSVYAKVFLENVVSYSTSTTADIVIRFFSDQLCTQPVNVSNLTINFESSVNCQYQSSSPDTRVVSGTSVVLASNVTVQWEEIYCDYGSYPCYNINCSLDYYLTSGSYYQIVN